MSVERESRKVDTIATILVIDDHPLYSAALVTVLEHVFCRPDIRTTMTVRHGLQLIEEGFVPDLVMLDLRLPDAIGISGLLQLRARLPEAPVVVISALAQPQVVASVLAGGAAGFVPKDATAQTLHEALVAVREGGRYVPEGYDADYPGPSARPMPSAQIVAQRIAELTPQQGRIIRLICEGKPNKQIAYEMSLAEATVKAHITALLRRLGVQNRTQAAVLVDTALLPAVGDTSEMDVRAFAAL